MSDLHIHGFYIIGFKKMSEVSRLLKFFMKLYALESVKCIICVACLECLIIDLICLDSLGIYHYLPSSLLSPTFNDANNFISMSFETLEVKNQRQLDQAIEKLKGEVKDGNLYNDIMNILQHDKWFKKQDREEIQRLCIEHSNLFTMKQRIKIAHPPDICTAKYPEGDLEYCLYDGPNDISRYQGHGEWDRMPGAFM